ncbi:MAG: SDR family NAD(P)-dependent oxidoreductase [bacterium]
MSLFSLLPGRKGIPKLAGKVVVITGAASGIGRELALQLAAKGCTLALVDIDEDRLNALGAHLRESNFVATTHQANVADRDRMAALAAEVAAAHGGIDVLINNAGIAYEGPFPQTSLEDWDRMIGVNLWSVIYGCHFFMPYLAKAERGHIVNLSSLFGIVGMAGQTAYCTTKFAIRGLSESLWEELRATSVGLTVVHPGGIATDIMKRAKGDDPELLGRLSDWYERNAMPPHKAAAKIVRAIETGKPRLLITPEATLGDMLRRVMPVLGNKLFGDAVIRILGVEDTRQKRSDQWQATMVDEPGEQA